MAAGDCICMLCNARSKSTRISTAQAFEEHLLQAHQYTPDQIAAARASRRHPDDVRGGSTQDLYVWSAPNGDLVAIELTN